MQPQDIAKSSKEELVNRFVELGYKAEEIEAEKSEIRAAILEKLKGDGEVIGHYTVTRVRQKRYDFKNITVDQARDLGATKEQTDTNVLRKLYEKGIKMPAEVGISEIEYPLIKELQVKE